LFSSDKWVSFTINISETEFIHMETVPAIDVSNPDAITYSTEELKFTILGGVRLEGLDRLRVTLRTEIVHRKFPNYMNNPELAALPMHQSLDLYNDNQVEKLIRKIAERLEVGITPVAQALAAITQQLEKYRQGQLEARQTKTEIKKALSETDTKAAVIFLEQPELLVRTNELIGRSGIIGESTNRLILWLIFTSRLTSRPLHAVSFGSSGTGKSHLQEKVGELIPEEDRIEITALTENAFYYFDETELGHKLILIEDLDGIWSALYPLRELQSKQRISKTVTIKDRNGRTRTIHLKVHGPVSIAGCTTQESLYEDNANRSFLIYLDESAEQDERIMDYQRQLSAGKIDVSAENQARRLLQHVQRVLRPVSVRNPYAEQLHIPKEVFKQRRSNAHYLAFIEVITFYKQYQRERKVDQTSGEVYIETMLEDIQEANALLKEILLRKSDELNGATRNYLEALKTWLQQHKQSSFTNAEVRSQFRIPISTVKRYHLALLQAGYIKRIADPTTRTYRYEIVSYEEYRQLQESIAGVLDSITGRLSGSTSAQRGSEPTKRVKANKLA
jgi:predicted transcriptional regulator